MGIPMSWLIVEHEARKQLILRGLDESIVRMRLAYQLSGVRAGVEVRACMQILPLTRAGRMAGSLTLGSLKKNLKSLAQAVEREG